MFTGSLLCHCHCIIFRDLSSLCEVTLPASHCHFTIVSDKGSALKNKKSPVVNLSCVSSLIILYLPVLRFDVFSFYSFGGCESGVTMLQPKFEFENVITFTFVNKFLLAAAKYAVPMAENLNLATEAIRYSLLRVFQKSLDKLSQMSYKHIYKHFYTEPSQSL